MDPLSKLKDFQEPLAKYIVQGFSKPGIFFVEFKRFQGFQAPVRTVEGN